MSIPLTINGQVFEYPQNFDESWGVSATGWAQAVTAGALYLSGGTFPLTAAVDFGSSFGIKVKSITSKTANPATSGYLLLAKSDSIAFRNNANSGNLVLSIDGSDNLTFNGSTLGTTSLTNGDIFVGNASNVPTAVALSGDATLTNTGALTIANSAITNAKVSASAAIATSKLAPLTASKAVVSDSGGLLAASTVTSTELGYSSGLSGNIQTQIGTLLPLAGGTMSGAISMASHKITSLTNGASGGDAVAYNQLRILQIVSATSTTVTDVTSSTYQATSLSAAITPTSTSSKVLVIVSGQMENDASAVTAYATIARNGTNVAATNGLMTTRVSAASFTVNQQPASAVFMDAPGSASALTYAVYIKNSDNSSHVFWGVSSMTQSIILMEIQ